MRERWFGATGRKVAAVVLEGTTDLTGAIVLGDVADVGALRAAHAAGVPVVIRAGTVEEIAAALAQPEVSCALVTDETLLTVDLADLTYG